MGLWERILDQSGVPGWAWFWTGERYARQSYHQDLHAAERAAAALQARGLEPGGTVAAILTNSVVSLQGVVGAWWSGASVASLPIIARGQSLPRYVAQLRRQCELVGARHLLIEGRYASFLRELWTEAEPELVACEELLDHPSRVEIAPPDEDAVAFTQFSSGTTAAPRGVDLTASAIDAQLSRLATHLQIDPERDVGAMWLPLSHDMGFFGGVLLAWYTGMRGVVSAPERFLADPRTWFDDLARFGATITIGPSFAYALAARASASRPLPGRLELRLCMQGGEPVLAAHAKRCVDAFGSYGLSLSAFTATYGLAEATLAVAIAEPEQEPRGVWVDGERLLEGELSFTAPGAKSSRELVSCGRPLPDFSVTHDGEIGELRVGGPSLSRGYRGQPRLTAAGLPQEQLLTGDLGFVYQGELYVIGRLDDRLITGGRNVDVLDIELEIGERTGVREGSCAIVDVSIGDSQKIVLVAELDAGNDPEQTLRDARTIAARRHGLRIDGCVSLEPGRFPKTPSGKAQRYRCRQLATTQLSGG